MKGYGIAIIGMALRFPKASSPEEFWNNICQGRNCIDTYLDSELLAAGISKEQLDMPDYVKVKGGVMDSPYEFDAGLFNYSENEARMMEPQIRIFHEIVWEALENAGYDPRNIPSSVGVYAGAAPNLYWQYANIAREDEAISSQFMLDYLVNTNYLSSRISYNFGFEGPSVFMYTACSTSLVSVHTACRALLGGECDIAVAGGSSIFNDLEKGYIYQEGMILSPDGQCRAFDENAKGIVPGEGAGVIVLKPLDAALSDGDNILGVIRSSAVNNDGNRKVGFSAPSVYAQADVIKTAMAIADIAPGELSYIETHGTGTPLGDSVEIEGLKLAINSVAGDKKCVLGSLKPNIGHLDSAAGIAGIIKVILAMKNKTIPPTINCDSPISALNDPNSKFAVVREQIKWENGKYPLVAGVSSFGIGGTNAHVILEEAPMIVANYQPGMLDGEVILLSERTNDALEHLSTEIVSYIENRAVKFDSLVYTLKTGRHAFPLRRLLLGKDLDDIKEKLTNGNFRDSEITGKTGRVIFVFSGMRVKGNLQGKELYARNDQFKTFLDRCFTMMDGMFGIDLRQYFEKRAKDFADSMHELLLCFCIAISLADTLKAYGITPEFAVGDSLEGELAAAYTSGLFAFEDLLPFLVKNLQQAPMVTDVPAPLSCKNSLTTMISSVTGESADAVQICSKEYWVNRPADDLLAEKASRSLYSQKNITILEFGQGGHLTLLLKENNKPDYDQEILHPLKMQDADVPEMAALNFALGILWIKGWDVKWRKMYEKSKVKRAILPGVQFNRKNYSIDLDEIKLLKEANSVLKNKDSSEVLNALFWKQKNETGTAAGSEVKTGWLIFCDDFGIGERLSEKLKTDSTVPILVKAGEYFGALSDHHFIIRCEILDDYIEMFSRLAECSRMPSHILHCFSIISSGKETAKHFREQQKRGFYSLLNIAKSLKMFEQSYKTEINVLTENMYRLCDEPYTFPATATLIGSVKVIPQEYPYLVCRNIDIDTSGSWELKRDDTLTLIYDEMLKTVEYPVVALRGKRKWIQDFQGINMSEAEIGTCLRKRGTYIIFGGLGDVGFSLASLLAYKYKADLIIAGKSKLNDVGADHTDIKNQLIQSRIDRLNQLKESGTDIHYVSLDVTKADEVKDFFDWVSSSYCNYNGVIYAAGYVSGPGIRFIDSLKKNDCEIQFLTKVYGVLNVAEAIKNDKPEFCLFVSSISSLLGGMEFAAYAGANAFLDAFILEHNYQHNMHWKVMDWDGMNSQQTQEQFERIASMKSPEQIFVSAGGNLKARLSSWTDFTISDEVIPVVMDSSNDIRNRLSSDYQEPLGETEKKLVKIWQQFFGILNIGVKDSFFELGGDSLKALTVISMIHKELNVKVSIQDFYKNLTISKLAKLMNGYSDKEYIPMKKAEEKDYYNLTPGQKRMYILWKLNQDSIAYNQTHVLQVDGKLEVERLIQAFSKLASRHDAFRTHLIELDGQPFMKVAPRLPLACEFIEADEESVKSVVQESVKPFNLLEASLYRIYIIKVKEDCFVLALDFHHILVDGVSFKIIIRELMEFYSGDEPEAQKFQYKDYSEWLQEPAQQERIHAEEKYWLDKFSGEVPLLNLKTDKIRPENLSYKGDSITFYFDTDKTLAIKKAAGDQGISLYVFLLSAYFVLLHKLTGQDHLVIGTPIAGRDIMEHENIVGFFVNTLAMKAELDGDKTFLSFKKYISDIVLQAFDHQLYPFDELVKKVGIQKMKNRNPLFDTMFVFQNMMDEVESTLKIPGVAINSYPYKNKTAQFDLTVITEERNDKIFFEFEYFTDLFDQETMIRYKDYFVRVIDECLKDDRIPLKDISLLDPAAEKQLLTCMCNHHNTINNYNSIQTIFEKQTEKDPEKQALVFEGEPFSYKELNERANQLANFLRRAGVTNNTIVGLLLEPSDQMIVAILAVLKAGGIYLPIDPFYPQKRINQILMDSRVGYILTEDDLQEEFEGREIYNLRTISLTQEHSSNPENITQKEDGAYIIYTSGTTGKQKGVLITHHNVIRLFYHDFPIFDFDEKDRWILCHSYCFDFSVWEIFGALLWGGTIVIIPNDVKKDTRTLVSVLHKEKITVLNQTPSAFMNIQAEILRCKDDFPVDLRYVIFGGENLKPHSLKAFRDQYPQTRLINMYGITEITVHSTFKEIREEEIEGNISNIGRPLPTLNIFLLDNSMKLVPIGVPGEIYVGGEGVAVGYLNKTQLTAERFVVNPYNRNEIIYKSGDIALIDKKGELIYIGRNDNQVQIRGFRVELGEIESCLLKIEGIENAFIVAAKNDSGFDILSAYLKTKKKLSLEDIRFYLKKELPDYMIPSALYQIERVPLTANHKIDIRELQRSGELIKSKVDFVKPASDMENQLTEIWKKVLNLDEISIKDNFFEIGGDSLTAIRAITKMEEALEREIPPVAIFSNFTIELLSKYLEHGLPEPVETGRDEIIDRGRKNRQKRMQIRKENEQ